MFQDNESVTFMGRVAKALIRMTGDTRRIVFIEHYLAFYEQSNGRWSEVLTMRSFAKLKKCLGINGLQGLDRLFGFMIVSELKGLFKHMNRAVDPLKHHIVNEFIQKLKNLSIFVDGYDRIFTDLRRL